MPLPTVQESGRRRWLEVADAMLVFGAREFVEFHAVSSRFGFACGCAYAPAGQAATILIGAAEGIHKHRHHGGVPLPRAVIKRSNRAFKTATRLTTEWFETAVEKRRVQGPPRSARARMTGIPAHRSSLALPGVYPVHLGGTDRLVDPCQLGAATLGRALVGTYIQIILWHCYPFLHVWRAMGFATKTSGAKATAGYILAVLAGAWAFS